MILCYIQLNALLDVYFCIYFILKKQFSKVYYLFLLQHVL